MSTLSPDEETPKRGTYDEMRRSAWMRLDLSAAERSACGVNAIFPMRFAFEMRRSAMRRSSLALASVVSIRSCVIRFAARFLSMARRLDVSRPNCLPAFL